MAFSDAGEVISAQDKTTKSTWQPVTTGDWLDGEGLVLVLASDDEGATASSSETTQHQSVDVGGVSLTKVAEYTNFGGSASDRDGATVSLWIGKNTTGSTIGSGATVTATFAEGTAATGISADAFGMGSGTLAVEDYDVLAEDGLSAIALSSLPNREYIFARGMATERTDTDVSLTPTTSYTQMPANGTTGGGAASNMAVRGEWRILTGTGDTSDPSGHSFTTASIFAAIYESTGGTNATVVTGPALAGAFSPPSSLVVDKILATRQGVGGVASPAAVVSAGNLIVSPPGLVGGAGLPSVVSTGATPIAQPAIAGALSPPSVVVATSPNATIEAPPAIGGVASPAGVVAADNKRPVRETLGGVVSPAPTVFTESFLTAPPALSGVSAPPGLVAIGGVADATIVSPPAIAGAAFPGAGDYTEVVQLNPRPATGGVLSPAPTVSVIDGTALIVSPPAISGVRLSQSGTQRTTRLAAGHGTSGVEFPGKGDYESVVQSREIPLLSGVLALAPFVFTNQPPSVEPTVVAPPAIAGCRVSVSSTQRSSTFTLAHASVGVLIPGASGGGGPVVPPPGTDQDWETPAISREDLDDAVSVTVGGHARSRSAVGSSSSSGSSGSATSKK